MNELKNEFLRLHVVRQLDIKSVASILNVPKNILSEWYTELKQDREAIAKIKKVWLRKKISSEFEYFFNWLAKLERKCAYCSISEEQIELLLQKRHIYTKRILTRGRSLEFDRKNPSLSYDDINNIVLCCYWCNNAKTDEFSYEEFKEVGKIFEAIWEKRLGL